MKHRNTNRLLCLALVVTFLLTGCGAKGKPNNMAQEVYDAGIKMVNVTNNYLNDEMNVDQTMNSISRLIDDVNEWYDNNSDAKLEEKLEANKVSTKGTGIYLSLVSISNAWLTSTDIKEKQKEIKSELKELKKLLGM